jgi:hypothetical protein
LHKNTAGSESLLAARTGNDVSTILAVTFIAHKENGEIYNIHASASPENL